MASPNKRAKVDGGKPDEFFSHAIRCLSADVVQGANSGHPGAPMGMAPVANILFGEYLRFDPKDSHWHNRDRFVLSNGHGCALLYSMLHLCGYKLTIDDLKSFRQLNSICPGHPERHVTEGVEVSTGPLGQGIANAVGFAIAEAHLAAVFNKPGFDIVDHHTYVFNGDGCLMEGIGQEALSLAGHLKLEKLTFVYDDNYISIDGGTDIAYNEDKVAKYTALGFHVIVVPDGDTNHDAIRAAFDEARAVKGKPKMIVLRTTIGYGAKLQGTEKVHGAPLGADDIRNVKDKFGRDPDRSYHIEQEVYDRFGAAASAGTAAHHEWNALFQRYEAAYPAEAAQYKAYFNNTLPEGWKDKLPRNDKSIATRKASENTLAVLFPLLGNLVGGSADLTHSNLTRPASANLVDFQPGSYHGRYFRFGVREHAMTGICNGIDAHGGLRAFGATFLNFVGYALGSQRLASLSHHGTIMVATHDGIGLGEDGPTHQPIELATVLRATPNSLFFRPCDQNETSGSWAIAIEHTATPSVIALTRQNTVPQATSSVEKVALGAYVLISATNPELVIVATGSEVGLAVEAAKALAPLRVSVVSMPCTQLFDKQPDSYQLEVFPAGVPVLSVEVYSPFGWERYSHYHVGMSTFGASAPEKQLNEQFGFTVENVAAKGRALVEHFKGKNVPQKGLKLKL